MKANLPNECPNTDHSSDPSRRIFRNPCIVFPNCCVSSSASWDSLDGWRLGRPLPDDDVLGRANDDPLVRLFAALLLKEDWSLPYS